MATEKEQLRILIAEDNKINQLVARKILEREGHIISLVNNGQEAIEKSAEQTFDIIFMDIHMPELNGWEATDVIRKREKNTGQRVPIIALTGSSMQEDKTKCLNAGMDDFITKPFSRGKLLQTIENSRNPAV